MMVVIISGDITTPGSGEKVCMMIPNPWKTIKRQ